MSHIYTFLALLLLLTLTSAKKQQDNKDLIQTSCMHARYPKLCLRTLSSYAGPAKTPRDLAQAAVQVSLALTRGLSDYLNQLASSASDRTKGERLALNDCVEQISDSVDQLGRTLNELKHLKNRDSFQWHMMNAETWVSAAMTYDYTCLDGFRDVEVKVKGELKRKISNVTKVTSNALYMIDMLDESRRKTELEP